MNYYETANRREGFLRWCAWETKFKANDPYVWMARWLNTKEGWDIEQRFWFAWLYGLSYNIHTAWLIAKHNPWATVTGEGLEKFQTDHYDDLDYKDDTKWNKGHLPIMFKSYQTWLNGRSQAKALQCLDFNGAWTAATSWYKFGRLYAWMYLQQIKHTCDCPLIEPSSLMLSDPGNKSVRKGLSLALGYDSEEAPVGLLELEAQAMLRDLRARWPELYFDLFFLETSACTYKKLHLGDNDDRVKDKKRKWLGYSLELQALQLASYKKLWPDEDWSMWDQMWLENLDPRLLEISPVIDVRFPVTGYIERLDWMFPDENGIPPPQNLENFFE